MSRITAKSKGLSDHPELLHYTSISALEGILKTNTLWATRITHLNDSSEMELIWSPIEAQVIGYLEKEINAYLETNPYDKMEFERRGGVNTIAQLEGKLLVENMRSGLLRHGPFHHFGPPFVVSFTTHAADTDRDGYHRRNGMLSQWRGYGGDDGVALVFHRDDISQLLDRESELYVLWPCDIHHVIYDENSLDVEEQFPDFFRGLQEEIKAFVKHDFAASEQIQTEKVAPHIPGIAGRFKHDAFHEERECRIVVGVIAESIHDEPIWKENRATKSFKQVHFRKGNYSSVPYIRLFEEAGVNLPIKRIIVGPSRNQEANFEMVQEFVIKRGICVEKSKTPFVGSV